MVLAIVSPGDVLANQDMPVRITVYTVSTIPVTVPRKLSAVTTVIHLDRALTIEEQLAAGLDRIREHNRDQAASNRLTESLAMELEMLWKALFGLRQDRITHLPAIVFDDHAVWYGADLRRAVTRYRIWKNAEAGS